MPIKCFFGDYSSHENEKKMLDNFLSQLVPVYGGDQDPWIYVVYNALWSGQEVDMVCFTQNSIVVADFKNYSGSLKGQENGEWVMNNASGEGIIVKGGGQISPFIQIRKNRYAVMELLKSEKLLVNDNIGHMSGLILFTELHQIELKLSHGVSQWFYVSDIPHIDQHLPSYGSKEINITLSEANDIIEILNLKEYQWTPSPPITAQYDPFVGEQGVHSNHKGVMLDLKDQKVQFQTVKPQGWFKKPKATTIAALVVASVLGYGLVDQLFKKDSFIANAADSITPSFVKKILAMTGLSHMGELRNHPDDLKLYGEDPEKITHFDSSGKEPLWTTFQLLDLEKGLVYGMKIGATSFNEVESLKLLNDSALLGDDKYNVVPGKVRNIGQLVMYPSGLTPEAQKKMTTYHPSFPQFDISNLSYINIWFSPTGIVRGVGFEVDERGNSQAIIPYIRRYKSLGYQVQEGSIAGHVGYSYAVLTKGDEVVVLNDPHMSPLSIVHTTKSTFMNNKDHLVRSKGRAYIPLGEIKKL